MKSQRIENSHKFNGKQCSQKDSQTWDHPTPMALVDVVYSRVNGSFRKMWVSYWIKGNKRNARKKLRDHVYTSQPDEQE